MKKSEFSEKAYEMFANHELLSLGYMIYIPSQHQEQKLGYDALWQSKSRKIKAIAVQYKIVEQYERTPKLLSNPCFKFELHKSSAGKYSQHNIMVQKNARSWPPICACYCVPHFVEYKALYKYLKCGTILENSCFLEPNNNISDSKYHFVAFDANHAYQFSDNPLPMSMRSLESIFEQQESMCFEDLIKEQYINEEQSIQSIDDYLIKSQSFLIIKLLDNNK